MTILTIWVLDLLSLVGMGRSGFNLLREKEKKMQYLWSQLSWEQQDKAKYLVMNSETNEATQYLKELYPTLNMKAIYDMWMFIFDIELI